MASNFWKDLFMYNENVLKWCSYDDIEDYYDDLLTEEDLRDEDVVVYDDSDEWYNIYETEADV